MRRVHCIGEILTEFVAVEGARLDRPGRFEGPFPSGAPAIFADQVALMGGAAELVGGLGGDAFGAGVLARLRDHGVGCGGVVTRAELATGLAFVAYRPDGGRDFVYSIRGTAAEVCDLTRFAPARGDVLHVSGSSLGVPPIREAVQEGVARGVAAGADISLDPNVRPELFADAGARRALDEVAARARWLFPSEEDMWLMHPGVTRDAALAAMRRTAEVVVLTRGAAGVLLDGPSGRVEIPGHAVEPVDATGAGDCFCGSFLARLLAGDCAAEAARLANAAAALSVTRRGPMEGNSALTEVRRFLGSG